jgi:hypothetical protein
LILRDKNNLGNNRDWSYLPANFWPILWHFCSTIEIWQILHVCLYFGSNWKNFSQGYVNVNCFSSQYNRTFVCQYFCSFCDFCFLCKLTVFDMVLLISTTAKSLTHFVNLPYTKIVYIWTQKKRVFYFFQNNQLKKNIFLTKKNKIRKI